jgi:purine-cytosine permease-like protein
MKRKLAWLGAILSALYLLTLGIMPDFVPFIDEGIAPAVLINCASHLGYDLRKWLPFVPKKNKQPASNRADNNKNVTIDV